MDDSFLDEEVQDDKLYVPLEVQRAILQQNVSKVRKERGVKREAEEDAAVQPEKKSLVQRNMERLRAQEEQGVTADEVREQEEEAARVQFEADIEAADLHEGRQLMSAHDVAHGVSYKERLRCTWTAPQHVRDMDEETRDYIRKQRNIIVEGTDVPNPCLSFADFKLPRELLASLSERGITQPTPIQQQGIPAVLSNRDVIGCAFTGSGKTMVFLIPMLMKCLSEERMMPLQRGEGPICLAMAPMRELAMQHYDIFCDYATALRQKRVADIRAFPAIGGSKRSDGEAALRNGCHACFATPGRLKDCLEKKTINFDICTFVCLDEADRMIDVGTEEEVREVYQHFKHQRQTVMFSATMPKKIKQFALTSLVDPITVNANRAGAANMDVRQEVEYVEREHKLINLLECLQKTQPPVLIFAEGKHDVDFVHEYLLLKLVSAVSIHGGKDQTERTEAITRFRNGSADVLVGTDVASKGLDFPEIQHVINYDVPRDIENYVHRIGRTGRNGKVGLATSFVNSSCPPTTLLDLKHLLLEARQRIPPCLEGLPDPVETGNTNPCTYCGGLGHATASCPKLQSQSRRGGGGFGGGEE